MLHIEDLRNNVSIEVELNTWEMAMVIGASMDVATQVKLDKLDRLELMHSISRFLRQIDSMNEKSDGVETVEIPLDLLDAMILALNRAYPEIVFNDEDERRLHKLMTLLELKANSAWFRMVSSVRAQTTEMLRGLEIACEDMSLYPHLEASRLSEIQQLLVDVKVLLDKTGNEVTEEEVTE